SLFLTHALLALAAFATTPSEAAAQPTLSASFEHTTIGPGSATFLRFVVNNASQPTAATDGAFTAVLPAGVTLAAVVEASSSCVDTVIDAPAGGSTISVADVRVPAFGSCTVSVLVTSSTPGMHMLATGTLTTSAGNSAAASATLTVATDRPGFTLSAAPASVPFRGRSRLTYTIDNTANGMLLASMAFTHALPTGVVLADPPRAQSDCGGALTAVAGTQTVTLSPGGVLAAGGTCTVAVDVRVGAAGPVGLVSGQVTAALGGFMQVVGGRAAGTVTGTVDHAVLEVDFLSDPVAPGATASVAYTLYNRSRDEALTGLGFQHDLDAALSGLVATGVSDNDCGATVTTGSTVSVSDAAVEAGGECHVEVTVQVPSGAVGGAFTSTTSALTADPSASVVGAAASDVLVVTTGPLVSLVLSPDPVGAGDVLTAEFTITNGSSTQPLSAISFTAPLDSFLPGASFTLPGTPCGAGSLLAQIGGNNPFLQFATGSLPAAGSCTFSATVTVPSGTPSGRQQLQTSIPTADQGGPVTGTAGGASVDIFAPPHLALSFEGAVLPGQSGTLSVTLTNNENGATTTGLGFALLPIATLTGATYAGLPASGFCGAGSSASVDGPGTTVTFADITLDVGSSCTFELEVLVPAAASPGTYTVSSSAPSGTVGSVGSTAEARSTELTVVVTSASIDVVDDPAAPGDTVTLRFTLSNDAATGDITGLSTSLNLGAELSGLSAIGLPMSDVCGAGSQLSGTTTLLLAGGALTAGSSCTFDVTLQVPAAATPGEYTLRTGPLNMTFDGSPLVASAISTGLVVGAPLMLGVALSESPVRAGGTTTLSVTLANAGGNTASALAFTLDLDAAYPGLVATALPSGGECGATITGTSTLSVSGGTLLGGAMCSFDVELTLPDAPAPQGGATLTTSALSGTVGGADASAPPAAVTLAVHALDLTLPTETQLEAGTSAELVLSLTNFTGGTLAEASATLSLAGLPSGVSVDDIAFDDACQGAVSVTGTTVLALRATGLAPGQQCDVVLTLSALATAAPTTLTLNTSPVTDGSAEVGAAASGVLRILAAAQPSFGLAVTPAFIMPGGSATLTYIVTNAGSIAALDGLAFTHALPTEVTVDDGVAATNDCGGTLETTAGSVALTGGSLGAMTTCTITVTVTSATLGEYTLTPSALDSSRGSLSAPSTTLSVVAELPDLGTPDGGTSPDGAVTMDGGAADNGTGPGVGGGGGCGCHVSGAGDQRGLLGVALVMLGLVGARRRRRGQARRRG
ncbi:MAG: hypothetical protein KC668_27130, partial [Myxococcales bacterium]|nr:hypothetical protein [Myxococcales bacterium]